MIRASNELAFCLVRPAMKEVERVKEGRRVDRINL